MSVRHIAELILVLMVAGGGRVVVLLAWPMRVCSRCKGTLRSQRYWWGGPVGACRRCHMGKQPRPGAVLVHRWRQELRKGRGQ